MHTILGAGGAIGSLLLSELSKRGGPVRVVARNAKPGGGATEAVTADLSDLQQTIRAVAGSRVVYLVAGLAYNLNIWRDLWPKIMQNTIEACKKANAKLAFFDNVYMYGKVSRPMTEATPFNPCSKKGEIRAKIATMLLDEIKAGNLTALVARAADFYGPKAKTGVANVLVFDKFAKGGKASVLVNDSLKHSYTFTADAAKSLVLLAGSEKSWNQTWHVPTASNPPTGKEFVQMVAQEFGVQPKYTILGKWMLTIAGIFDLTIRELPEMLYQNEFEYLFDSTKFEHAFNFKPTSYAEGIKRTVAAYR
jgi:nucleoside-diphosphate-sugar epimerase